MARATSRGAKAFGSRRRAAHLMGVVDQVVLASSPRNRLAAVLGFILGGVVPVATYTEAHLDLDSTHPLHEQAATFLVVGGLVFSGKTVFAWAKSAFQDAWKAAGFVLLLEGVMITSNVPVLPLVLLGILVAINGIATGCILSLDRTSDRTAAAPSIVVVAKAEPGTALAATTLPAPTTLTGRIPSSSRAQHRRSSAPQGRFAFEAPS
jgi:hypothetical protein